MSSRIGGECPNCREAGILHIDDHFVRCDNCDFERFSTQEELDRYVNEEEHKKNPISERLITLQEHEPCIPPRASKPIGMRDLFKSKKLTD